VHGQQTLEERSYESNSFRV